MTEKKGKRRFTKEFKEDAVRLVVEGGRNASEVAQDLGIEANMLHRWKREMRAGGSEAFPGTGNLSSQDEELRRLKRENADIKEERDILKKAMAIFSKKPR
jgi:transposase